MVLVTDKTISGVIGPLPYDYAECLYRQAEINAEIVEKTAAQTPEPPFVANCVIQPESPKINDTFIVSRIDEDYRNRPRDFNVMPVRRQRHLEASP